jgi:ATP-dependent Clp protease protease subunit
MFQNKKRCRSLYLLDGDSDSDHESEKNTKIKYARNDGQSNKIQASVQHLDNRIYFSGKVNTDSVTNLIKQLNHYNSEFTKLQITNQNVAEIVPKPIFLHIQSYGGALLACFAAVDAIKSSKIPIHTVVDGFAASCGSLMAIVGHKRYMTKNSFVLMHQLSSGVVGKMADIEDEYDNCKKFMDKIYGIYEENTTMTTQQLKDQLKHDHWWDSEDCLKHGIIDGII